MTDRENREKKQPAGRHTRYLRSWAAAGPWILLALLPACTGPAWETRYQEAVAKVTPVMAQNCFSTSRYHICSDADTIQAPAVGTFMEMAAAAYDRALNLDTTDVPPGPAAIWLYTERRRYRRVAAGLGFHSSIPAFFSPVAPAAIHVRWDKSDEKGLFSLLLHEGLHQQVNARWRIGPRATGVAANNTGNGEKGQIGIPLWLNEGLATYMEAAHMIDGRLVTGQINRDRLRELVQRLQKTGPPDLKAFLSRPYGSSFDSGDYAVAWGLVYDLKHGAGKPETPDTPDLLDRYLKALADDLVSRYRMIAGDNPTAPDIDFHTWNPVLAQRSLSLFLEIVTRGSALDAWEQAWRQRILTLGAGYVPD